MARHMAILLLATFALSVIGSRTVNAEIDETDRILEAAGPQIIELNRCYEREATDNRCKPSGDTVESVFKSCSLDEISLSWAFRKAAPKLTTTAVERLLSSLRDRASTKIESRLAKRRENPRPCVHLL
jgi:hypothetical protein